MVVLTVNIFYIPLQCLSEREAKGNNKGGQR